MVGTEDGHLEFYDHNLKITNSAFQLSTNEIVYIYNSGAVLNVITADSLLFQFDPISCASVTNYQIGLPTNRVTCFTPHPLLPHLFAYGSTDQSIKLCQLSSGVVVKLQSIRYHDGFLGQRLGNINKLAWHPSRMILGTVTSDSFISIYGINKQD